MKIYWHYSLKQWHTVIAPFIAAANNQKIFFGLIYVTSIFFDMGFKCPNTSEKANKCWNWWSRFILCRLAAIFKSSLYSKNTSLCLIFAASDREWLLMARLRYMKFAMRLPFLMKFLLIKFSLKLYKRCSYSA